MSEVIYTGFKIDDSKLELSVLIDAFRLSGYKGLERTPSPPHVTVEFRPIGGVNERLLSKEVDIKVIGHANDGKNEGLLVELSSPNREMQKEIDKIEVQHITISYADGAKPVDTKNLDFQPLPWKGPIRLHGIYGAFEKPGVFRTEPASRIANIEAEINKKRPDEKPVGEERPTLSSERRHSIR